MPQPWSRRWWRRRSCCRHSWSSACCTLTTPGMAHTPSSKATSVAVSVLSDGKRRRHVDRRHGRAGRRRRAPAVPTSARWPPAAGAAARRRSRPASRRRRSPAGPARASGRRDGRSPARTAPARRLRARSRCRGRPSTERVAVPAADLRGAGAEVVVVDAAVGGGGVEVERRALRLQQPHERARPSRQLVAVVEQLDELVAGEAEHRVAADARRPSACRRPCRSRPSPPTRSRGSTARSGDRRRRPSAPARGRAGSRAR